MKNPVAPLLLFVILLANCQREELSSAIDLTNFELEEGFDIQLVVAEPLVMDPVAMEIDENGKMYVVEMPGYPLDVSGSGRIKVLRDTDDDGRPDESIVFAEGLILPTGIMRWKNGVIVTDAPDVLYLEDTDGDDRADKKEVLLTGFSRSNPQHNMNTPKYGLDNWIYLGHEGAFITKTFEKEFGGRGEEIRFPGEEASPTLPQNAGNRSVRFQPDQKRLEMLSGKTQFGYTFDNWGHLFCTSNATHLFHEVIAARYLAGKEALPITSVRNYLPEYGPAAEVFPIAEDPEHQILTDVGTITSASGLTWYQGGAFPAEYDRVTFVAEPVHNLIHTDVVMPEGASFVARRHLANSTFLASKDTWFRPVNFYIGPSGELYIIDYHRQYIEHPEWMAKEVVMSGQLYNGRDKGRIYKVVARDQPLLSEQSLAGKSADELIPLLAHPNIWWRKHAQRLLVQNDQKGAVEKIVDFALETDSDLGLVHAMWTLEGLGAFETTVLQKAFEHETAGVRENVVKIIELHFTERPDLIDFLKLFQNDEDPQVRFQLLCSAALLKHPGMEEIRQTILTEDMGDEWVQIAALAGMENPTLATVRNVIENSVKKSAESAPEFVEMICRMIGKSGRLDVLKPLIAAVVLGKGQMDNIWKVSILKGLSDGIQPETFSVADLATERQALLNLFAPDTDPALRRNVLLLLEKLNLPRENYQAKMSLARTILTEEKSDAAFRTDAILLLSLGNDKSYTKILEAQFKPSYEAEIHKAALRALSKISYRDYALDRFVFDHWKNWTPEVKEVAIALLMTKEETVSALLDEVEAGGLHRSNIKWSHTFRLLNYRKEEIRLRARKLLAGPVANKEEVLRKYQVAMQGNGEWANGKKVFADHCSICHQIGGQGGLDFGPDLGSIRNRTKEAILRDIVLPNEAIADGFEMWEVKLADGGHKFGIIKEEVGNQLVLRDATGNDAIVERNDILDLQPMNISAMPEGLDREISEGSMVDLLAYLKSPHQ